MKPPPPRILDCIVCAMAAVLTVIIVVAPNEAAHAASPATAPGSQPATRPADSLEHRVTALVDQFFDLDPTIRDQAVEDMLDIGEPARKYLIQALKREEAPEPQLRIAFVLRRLGLSARPTRFSLHLKDVPASQVLSALEAEAGVRLLVPQPAARARLASVRMSFDADRLPYWLVMRSLCNAVNLKPDPSNPTDGALSLVEGRGNWSAPYTSVDGVFAVHLSQSTSRSHIEFGAPAEATRVHQLVLEAYAERQAHVLWCDDVRATRCQDESGRDLAVQVASTYGLMMKSPGCQLIRLSLDPLGAKKLLVLEGEADFVRAREFQHIALPDIAKAQKDVDHDAGDFKFRVNGFIAEGQGFYLLKLGISPGKNDPAALAELTRRLENNPPDLVDAKDQPFAISVASLHEPDSGPELLVSYDAFANLGHGRPGAPKALSWNLATKVEKVQMHFQFTKILLP